MSIKNYYIKCQHEVYIDDFNEGVQGECLNSWNSMGVINATCPLEAIQRYFKKDLPFSFKKEDAHIDHEAYGINCLQYSNYVDNENSEVEEDSEAMVKFRNGESMLFLCNTFLEIWELVPAKI